MEETFHTHTPPKWIACHKDSFFRDMRELMDEFSFSATIPKHRVEELLKKYNEGSKASESRAK